MRTAYVLLLLAIVLPLASSLPRLAHGDLEVTIDGTTGTINIRYFTTYVEGKIAIWGPNFYYDSTYWGGVGNAYCEVRNEILQCYAESPDGTFTWRLKPIVGPDFILFEYTVTAVSNWTYYAIAWVLDLPVNSFSGINVFAILLPYGSTEKVTLRPEHVPGQPDLRSSGSGAGWVVPIGMQAGIAVTFFTDAAPRVNIAATDEREWGGASYRLRFYYPGEWGSPKRLKPGDQVNFFVYIHTFTSEREMEIAKQRVFTVSYLRDTGLPSSELLNLIRENRVEEYFEQKKRERQLLLATYALAAVCVAVIAVVILRRRSSSFPKF